ncbi:MAG: hypothetical protein JO288_22710 [Hyphomicrobiales bacterium]|nr:hypothetical protein [Hyphomicrobiales bacterium]
MLRIVICAVACAIATVALAQQADSPLKSAMKLFGFATDPPAPADFVLKSRPPGGLDYIPVFQPPPEPAKPALSDKDLKTLKGDLDSVQKRDDALRAAYPPAAKAAAEQAAGKKPKANAGNQ